MSVGFRKISVTGTPAQIGLQTGMLLKNEIRRNIDFYIPYIQDKLPGPKLTKAVVQIKSLLNTYCPHLLIEIESMAAAAEVDPVYMMAMNARTELLLSPHYNECTAVVFPRKGLLGQNWDWSSRLEKGTVVVEITRPDGLKIIQLTEAGICGKIGMNNRGIGVTLNILKTFDRNLTGMPIHIVMRNILECKNLQEARQMINRLPQKTASNLVVADTGDALDVEYGGPTWQLVEITDDYYVHTNHYIHLIDIPVDGAALENSKTRYYSAINKLQTSERTMAGLKAVLSDTREPYPVFRKYIADPDKHLKEMGTLATIVMDLKKRVFAVRKGNPASAQFEFDRYDTYQITDPSNKE